MGKTFKDGQNRRKIFRNYVAKTLSNAEFQQKIIPVKKKYRRKEKIRQKFDYDNSEN